MAPRVLQVIPELNTGGAEKTVLEMSQALHGAGWHSFVACQGGVLVPQIEEAGGQVLLLGLKSKNPFTIWRNSHRLARLIKEQNIDLIHARSRAPAWSALWAAKTTNIPFVTTYHGAHSQRTFLKRFYNSVMARGDVVIANSDYTAQQIETYHGAYIQHMETIYRGVDLEKNDLGAVSRERQQVLRAQWGVSEDTNVILQPARLSRRKGQSDVIAAMADLKRQGLLNQGQLNNVVLIMAGGIEGNEAYHDQLQTQIKAEGLEGIVKCVGFCADMPAAFAISDIVLAVSSKPESFGRVVAESMAMGLPLIVSEVGAQPEVIEDESGGIFEGTYLVPPHDPQAIGQAILALQKLSAGQRQAYARLARAHMAKKYSIETLKQQTMDVYRQLLGV